MTPGARVAATIEILDTWLDGAPIEQVLTNWARRSRFAGSKDRAAIRDLAFDCLRNLRVDARVGGAEWPSHVNARALMIGLCRRRQIDLNTVFTGQGHAPLSLSPKECAHAGVDPSEMVTWNLPDWLIETFKNTLDSDAEDQAKALCGRAPTTIRINTRVSNKRDVSQHLDTAGYQWLDNPVSPTALTVTSNARGLVRMSAYQNGWFELQDASSQAVVDHLTLENAGTILDFCAGGGGKTLALAARSDAAIDAYDLNPARMKDLPDRARRAGVKITCLKQADMDQHPTYDLVFADAPCSGSGAWRRAPESKWRFSEKRLNDVVDVQRNVLARARNHVSGAGVLAYATCSILHDENDAQAEWFLSQNPDWVEIKRKRWPISTHGDGFFLVQFRRKQLNCK